MKGAKTSGDLLQVPSHGGGKGCSTGVRESLAAHWWCWGVSVWQHTGCVSPIFLLHTMQGDLLGEGPGRAAARAHISAYVMRGKSFLN